MISSIVREILSETSKKFVARRKFQKMLLKILLLTYENPTNRQGVESYLFAIILILPNFAIFHGLWLGIGHLNAQLLGNYSRYWHEIWPKCLS